MADVFDRLKSALCDRYVIERELGAGGMATVFLARDLKHDRTVAIKVLRPELAEAIGAGRFLREIRTTANLSHPHILPLFDSGETEGFLYYVMPLVEGESLQDRLDREGQLPVEDAVRIAREVADALSYAHDKGVIHRDVKPANILLERGRALLADFGIAQARAGADETRLTGTGISLGTPAYMSPEQISAAGEVDGRADQYALACVLYEMLAGFPPFTGADIQTVMLQHLVEEAPRVTGARALVSKSLADTVHRAMAKGPADRFRNMGEFERALAGATLPLLARIPLGRARTVIFAGAFVLALASVAVVASVWAPGGGERDSGPVGGGTSEAEVPSVVVLPLLNLSGDPGLDELGEEIVRVAEEWLSELGEMIQPFPVLSSGWAAASEGEDPGPRRRWIRQAWPDSSPATFAVLGDYRDRGDSLEVGFSLQDREGHVVGTSLSARLPYPGVREHLNRLWCPVAGMVAAEVDPWHDVTTMITVAECPKPEAIEALIEGTKEYVRPGGPERWGDWLRRAAAADSTYVFPLLKLVEWYDGFEEFARADSLCGVIETRFPDLSGRMRLAAEGSCAALWRDKDTSLERTRALEHFSPYNTLEIVAIAFRRSNRLHEALEALSRWNPPTRNDYAIRMDRYAKSREAEILHLLGEHERELEVAREARKEYPRDGELLVREVVALIALGQVAEAMDSLEAAVDTLRPRQNPQAMLLIPALECEVHGCEERSQELLTRLLRWYEARPPGERDTPAVKRSIAVQLLNLNRAQEALPIWRELVDRDPGNLEYLGELGLALAMAGEEAEAREIAERLSGWDEPWFWGRSTYWRACIAANLGESEEAVDLLWQADDRGNYVNNPPPQIDPRLRPLRGYPPFQDYIKPRG